jgi:hypothetical protein
MSLGTSEAQDLRAEFGQKPSFDLLGAMVSDAIIYLHLEPESTLPDMHNEPTRTVVIIEANVSPVWQEMVSNWIVRSGCLYMMAWGIECSSWDDSVDWANIDKYGEGPIPDDGFVATTWHSDETLANVFWFSKNCATHPVVDLKRTMILDISNESRKVQLLKAYDVA